MGHSKGSTILEDHYDDEDAEKDVEAIANGRREDTETIQDVRSQALNRVDLSMNAKERRETVAAWVEQPSIKEYRKNEAISSTNVQ